MLIFCRRISLSNDIIVYVQKTLCNFLSWLRCNFFSLLLMNSFVLHPLWPVWQTCSTASMFRIEKSFVTREQAKKHNISHQINAEWRCIDTNIPVGLTQWAGTFTQLIQLEVNVTHFIETLFNTVVSLKVHIFYSCRAMLFQLNLIVQKWTFYVVR